jgi:hypothetical protein
MRRANIAVRTLVKFSWIFSLLALLFLLALARLEMHAQMLVSLHSSEQLVVRQND